MSNLFRRPKPELATVNDVEIALKEIANWDWTTGYTFAHIVIDDGNLRDVDILYCLYPDRIAETMNQRIRDRFGNTDFDKLEPWELEIYRQDVVTHMVEVIDLLNWLLNVPIEIRNEVD